MCGEDRTVCVRRLRIVWCVDELCLYGELRSVHKQCVCSVWMVHVCVWTEHCVDKIVWCVSVNWTVFVWCVVCGLNSVFACSVWVGACVCGED